MASRASLSRNLGTAYLDRAVVLLFRTLIARRHWTRKELESTIVGVGVEGFYGERDGTGINWIVRWRVCDAKDSCGTVFPALWGLERHCQVAGRGKWWREGHWRGRRDRRRWRDGGYLVRRCSTDEATTKDEVWYANSKTGDCSDVNRLWTGSLDEQ